MSDLFLDMYRHRPRWHSYQNEPSLSPSASTSTINAASPCSPHHIKSEDTFSHHSSNADGTDTVYNINYINYKNETNEGQVDANGVREADDDLFSNTLSLQLRKPKHWKWELTTSKSCSNIALPRILLYDHKGKLLVDIQDVDECVYRQEDYEKIKRDKSKKRTHKKQQQQQQQQQEWQQKAQYTQRSATTNLKHSIRNTMEREFNGLEIKEATPPPEPFSRTSSRSHCSRKAIDLNTADLPECSLSRRSSSLKGVRFNVEESNYLMSQIPTFLPTPPSTITTPTSSSSGPREKRRYRRSHSSGKSSANSESILERFSYQKSRFSSPEYAEEQKLYHGPRYFLRTSRAGTLVIQENSFSQKHLRRRRRSLCDKSTESFKSTQKSPSYSNLPAQRQSVSNSSTPSEINCRKQRPICRHLTDGNILLNKQSTSSEEDVGVDIEQKQLVDNARHLRKHAQARNQTKADLNYSPDVKRNTKVR